MNDALRRLTCLIALAASAACTAPTSAPTATAPQARAAVAVPDAHAADVAAHVLARGGNAVDAAIAVALSLAVTYPEAGNIGGGGFMLIHFEGRDYFLDYREVAPAAASRDMYLDADANVIEDASLVGHLAAGVPGTVAGLWAAHRRFGSLPWATLVEPAQLLAADGFDVPRHLAQRIGEGLADFAGKTNFASYYADLASAPRFVQPELAATLARIARDGRDGFYAGLTAQLIANDMRANGGIITLADLAGYRAVWREPLRARWRDMNVVSAPPPSSGGFAVVQLLKMKDALAARFEGLPHNSAQYVHLIAEMEKRVFADRAQYLGDPDFVDVPIEALLSDAYLARRAAQVDLERFTPLDAVSPGLEERNTTHFSILDAHGNAVANTYTLNTWFGSGAVVEGAGFLLNNEMDDFSVKPGVANFYGVVGADANAIAPGKRMLSSMSPTLLTDDSGVRMVVGTPGGSTIFTSTFQAIVNVLDFALPPSDAVSAPRFHHQLLPPELITYSICCPLDERVVARLAARGYDVRPHAWEFGDLQMIWRDGATLEAAADRRGRGVGRVFAVGVQPNGPAAHLSLNRAVPAPPKH